MAEPNFLTAIWGQLRDAKVAFIALCSGVAWVCLAPTDNWVGYIVIAGALGSLTLVGLQRFRAGHSDYQLRVLFGKLTSGQRSMLYVMHSAGQYNINAFTVADTDHQRQMLELEQMGLVYRTVVIAGGGGLWQFKIEPAIEPIFAAYWNALSRQNRIKAS